MNRIVVALGNRMRSDDGVGPAVLDALRRSPPSGVAFMELGDDATALVDALDGVEHAVLIDATCSGAEAGAVMHFPEAALQDAGFPRASTHTVSLIDALGLCAALGHTPEVDVIGIEAQSVAPGAELSPAVSAAVPRAVALVLQQLTKGE
jgi:hydrogenase maturation protease